MYLNKRGNYSNDSGVDLFISARQTIEPAKTRMLDLGIWCKLHGKGSTVAMPYMLVPRSSMGLHTPLRMSNSIGVIDAGYTGSVKLLLDNTGKYSYTAQPGARLCQVVSPDMRPIEVNIVDNIENPSSRQEQGIGSTGPGWAAVPAPWEPPVFSVAETSRAFRRAPHLEKGQGDGSNTEHRAKVPQGSSFFNAVLDRVAAVGIEDKTSYGGDSITDWCGCDAGGEHAAVARPVSMKETQWNEKAKAAMDKEWNRLKSIKTCPEVSDSRNLEPKNTVRKSSKNLDLHGLKEQQKPNIIIF